MRVKWSYKIAAFTGSVIALSWFFAGWRQIQEVSSFANWAFFFGAIVLTSLLICLQAYWIYFEEKSKGTLRKRIAWFEKINTAISARSGEIVLQGEKGEPKTHE